MGGGDKPKAGGAEGDLASASPALVMEAVCEFMKIPATKRDMTVMAKLRARLQPDEDRRAPITICAAIDRSGSMKDHLPLLKETLQFMMQQLRAEDMLCLVTFDHEVCTEPLGFMLRITDRSCRFYGTASSIVQHCLHVRATPLCMYTWSFMYVA